MEFLGAGQNTLGSTREILEQHDSNRFKMNYRAHVHNKKQKHVTQCSNVIL